MDEVGVRREDWLDEGAQEEQKIKEADAALAFAQQHLFFESDPRAAGLLKLWEDTVCARRVPIGSSLDAYAAAEAVRAFVGEIRRQVTIAKTGKLV